MFVDSITPPISKNTIPVKNDRKVSLFLLKVPIIKSTLWINGLCKNYLGLGE